MLYKIFLFCFIIFLPSFINGQQYQWQNPSFINIDLGGGTRYDMEIDDAGNIYILSLFESEVAIGDTVLYTSKDDGVFLSKFDKDNQLVWARIITESKESTPISSRVIGNVYLEIDASSIYPIIEYRDTIVVDSQLFVVDQSQTYYQNIVIFQLSLNGDFLDNYDLKGTCEKIFGDIKINNNFLYFHFNSSRSQLDIDSFCTCEIDSNTIINSEDDEAFVGRINMMTSVLDWVIEYNAGGSDVSVSKIDIIDDQLYISGTVFSSLDLINNNDTMSVPDIYSRYGYLSKYSLEGEYQWSQYCAVKGWDSYIIPQDIVVSPNGDVTIVSNVISQSVQNKVFFENETPLQGVGNDHNFVVLNYDSIGNINWYDISNSSGNEGVRSVGCDNDNNLYLTGTYNQELTFDNIALESATFSDDIFVLSYDSFGNKNWAQKAGGNGSDVGSAIKSDSLGNLYIMGSVSDLDVTFGAYEVLPPGNGNSIFVTQMVKQPIGLNETSPSQFGVRISPNPSMGNVNIEVFDEELSKITIYNQLGQEIETLNIDTQTNKMSLNNLSKGFYFIDIHVKSGKHVNQKLIVK